MSLVAMDPNSVDPDHVSDKERLAAWELGVKVAQLQFQGFSELQDMLRREKAARELLEAKVEKLTDALAQRIDTCDKEIRDNVGARVRKLEEAELPQNMKRLKEGLDEERSLRATQTQELREESLGLKFQLEKRMDGESSALQKLHAQVAANEEVRKLELEGSQKAASERLADGMERAMEACYDRGRLFTDASVGKLRGELLEETNISRGAEAEHDRRVGLLEVSSAELTEAAEQSWQRSTSLQEQLTSEAAQREALAAIQGQFEQLANTRLDGFDFVLSTKVKHMEEILEREQTNMRHGRNPLLLVSCWAGG
ncbi:hypothetical protein CYMTET_28202 [Cymbomonas tetramitiformis]|uniref:Uncharacterized protein n=1 Tax=Cymbomonas tetramitiformis TaxID=36881 RepID=A0AAE0KWE6_9CHLO|nr:hypothetical protein CYMTET_28202 [Cymbomonas tetramitiformis]